MQIFFVAKSRFSNKNLISNAESQKFPSAVDDVISRPGFIFSVAKWEREGSVKENSVN